MSPDLTLIQFSDTHIQPEGALMHGVVDTHAALAAAVDVVRASGVVPAAVLLTGDLTDSGEPAAYRRLRALVEPIEAPLVSVMGNHDERTAFRTELLGTDPSTMDHDVVVTVDGLRIVVLDSSLPGHHDGHLGAGQLEWLAEVLREPAARGTLLVLHHPPLPSPVPTVNLLRLRDSRRLAEVIDGSGVRMVITGHAHHTGCGTIGGVPVWVGPATAYGVEPVPPRGRLTARAFSGFSRIDVIGDQVVATAVPVSSADRVYDVDETTQVGRVRAMLGDRA
ncbi:metallophosphoesterase family protein [Actinokineospora xionganensis]|uniref:Metallophosphoesterase n=1 Tax=Actinokineospora xionganensis TaxID=2684470 RepID=A0ABR7L3C5_9PSEU|nr:metallophosphoesterase [Actinokineospora xionganensis]MBC6446886.1 metallophosphoesterase [Actinokineospora xionganensis]